MPAKKSPRRPRRPVEWQLRLYIAGRTEKAMAALENLKRICAEHLEGRYSIEVIDLLENPRLARDDQILAIPTLVRKLPEPLRKIVGDLSNREKMVVGFDLQPHGAAGAPAQAGK